ncbi:AfsR/SARP family transcriptional regulator [Micromonospora sp. NPDC049903]|uniref:AfsR/SARP family transcriptional regulator n=1 Tax=Micromonospora sp. NPDC049903 TaxID=3364276 RepID=UPI0037BA3B03
MTATAGSGQTADDEYRVLGPLVATLSGRPVPVTAPKQRVFLAALLLRANTWVGAPELVGAAWHDRPPENPRAALHVHLSRLRSLFAGIRPEVPAPIETRPGAYRIVVPPGSLDLHRYREAATRAREARRAGRPDAEVHWVRQALAEWRGEPLALVPSVRIRQEVVTGLVADLLHLTERRFELELALGRHAEVVGELRTAVVAHPQRERLWAQLMEALAGSGDRAAALAAYHRARDRLREEFGATPGLELRQRYRRLLAETGDTARTRTPHGRADPPVVAARTGWRAQCQLPPDVADFTGRAGLLAELHAALRSTPDGPPVVCLTGAPGVGKSALAVRTAHRLRDRFPDGQWYAHASEADGAGRDWPQLLAELLTAAGEDRPPATTAAGARALQRRLAGRRVLIVIDDLHDASALRGLFPLAADCAVLVTHRGRPEALVACPGVRVVALDVLSPAEAATLLTVMIGPGRVERERAALDALVAHCDRLPLALRIAGAHLATHPTQGIGEFVELLGANPLDALSLPGSRRAAVRTAFHLAYTALPARTRRIFRLLALVPGVSHRAETVAELAGLPVATAAQGLDELVRAQLVEQGRDGAVRLHSLMARYAAERGRAEDTPAYRRAALRRLGEWYLRTADEAVRLCHPDVVRVPATHRTSTFGGRRAARGWLARERRNLVAVAVHAASTGLVPLAVRLTDALRGPCGADRHHADWRLAAEAAVDATDPAREPVHAAIARLNLGLALQGLHDLDAAEPHLRHARDRLHRHGPAPLEMVAVTALAMHRLQRPRKRFDEAIRLLHRGLRLCRRLGLRQAQARCLLHLGMAHHGRGDLRLARRHLMTAARIGERLGSCSAQPEILARLGTVCGDLGAHREAVRWLREALRLGRCARSAHSVALASYGLARVGRATGHRDRAHRHVGRAMAFAEEGGYVALLVNARNLLAALHQDEGRADLAEPEYRRALREAERIGHPQARCEALIGLAVLAQRRGHHREARDHVRTAAGAARAAASVRLQAHVRQIGAGLRRTSSAS